MDWMLFYRETDKHHFLFNGAYIIGVSPGSPAWADDGRRSEAQQIESTERDVYTLRPYLNNGKRSFIIHETRCVVVERGIFKQ